MSYRELTEKEIRDTPGLHEAWVIWNAGDPFRAEEQERGSSDGRRIMAELLTNIAAKDAEIARLKQAEESGVRAKWDCDTLTANLLECHEQLAAARQQLQEAQADAKQAVKIGCDWMNEAARLKNSLAEKVPEKQGDSKQ